MHLITRDDVGFTAVCIPGVSASLCLKAPDHSTEYQENIIKNNPHFRYLGISLILVNKKSRLNNCFCSLFLIQFFLHLESTISQFPLLDKSLVSALHDTINTSLTSDRERQWDLFWPSYTYIILSAQSTGLSQNSTKVHFKHDSPPKLKTVTEQKVLFLQWKYFTYILSHCYYSRFQISFWHFCFSENA